MWDAMRAAELGDERGDERLVRPRDVQRLVLTHAIEASRGSTGAGGRSSSTDGAVRGTEQPPVGPHEGAGRLDGPTTGGRVIRPPVVGGVTGKGGTR